MKAKGLYEEIDAHLRKNILKFWVEHDFDYENNTFYGYLDAQGNPKAGKESWMTKSCVLCSRLLWTFSKAYRRHKSDEYKKCADIAFDNLIKYFYDKSNGGFYWSIDYQNKNPDTRKHLYVQSFAIYALSEYYMAFNNADAIKIANELFDIIDTKCRDNIFGGFFENFDADWNKIDKFALAPSNINCEKTMNTTLHLMEALTSLYEAEKSQKVREMIIDILDITFDKIQNEEKNGLKMFFSKDWKTTANAASPGHDIETSWLICRSADAIENKKYIRKSRDIAFRLCNKVLKDGIDDSGTIKTRVGDNNKNVHFADMRDWWAEAEGTVGFLNLYQLTGDEFYFKKCLDVWNTAKKYFVDDSFGEWFGHTLSKEPDTAKQSAKGSKAGFWKCPYHNSRMCFEILERLEAMK